MYNNMWLILMKRDFFLQLEIQLGFPPLGSLSVPTVLLTCMMVHRAKNRSYGSIRFVISSIVLGSHQYWQLIAWSVNHTARLAVIVSPITMLSRNFLMWRDYFLINAVIVNITLIWFPMLVSIDGILRGRELS